MAFLRLSTPRPLFYCSQCSTRKGPAMLTDNDALSDPKDMAKAHRQSTGHTPVLIGGFGYITIVSPCKVKCIHCMDGTYVANRDGVRICPCIESNLTAGSDEPPEG